MTQAIQILGSNASGPSTTGGAQPTGSASPVNALGFNALMEILASLLTVNGGAQTTSAQSYPAAAQSADPLSQTTSSSGTSSGNSGVTLLEQLTSILSGSGQSKQGKDSASNSQTAAQYSLAGLAIAPAYPSMAPTQTDLPNNPQLALTGITTAMLSQVEKELASLVETNQLSATQGSSSAIIGDIAQPNANSESNTANPASTNEQSAVSPATEKELANLLSIASGSAPDPKALKELNAILAGVNGGDAVSMQDILQRLEASAKLAASVQPSQPVSQGYAVAPSTGTASAQVLGFPQQPTINISNANQQGVGAPVPSPQGNGTTASAQQSNVTAASVASPVSAMTAATIESAATQGNATASLSAGAASASPQANTVSQGSNLSAAATQPQIGQIQATATGQGNQSTAGSGKDSADLLKADASQAYIAASGQQKVSTTFQQTLSAVAQNRPTTLVKPDALQLAQNMVREVRLMSQQGKTVVNMKLEPESLGSVTLQVSSEGGKISAQFNVKTADARAYLEANVPEIRQALETNGVSVSHLGVNLSGGELPAGNQQFGYQPKRQRTRYYSNQGIAAISIAAPETSRTFGYNTMEMQL